MSDNRKRQVRMFEDKEFSLNRIPPYDERRRRIIAREAERRQRERDVKYFEKLREQRERRKERNKNWNNDALFRKLNEDAGYSEEVQQGFLDFSRVLINEVNKTYREPLKFGNYYVRFSGYSMDFMDKLRSDLPILYQGGQARIVRVCMLSSRDTLTLNYKQMKMSRWLISLMHGVPESEVGDLWRCHNEEEFEGGGFWEELNDEDILGEKE